MNMTNLIDETLIQLNLKSKTKTEVISEMVSMLHKANRISDEKSICEEVMKREAHGSTGIGFGIAIPHVKSSAVLLPSLVFGQSQLGIDYESMDDEKAHLFFMIAVPDTGPDIHLKTLAKLSRHLIDDTFRIELMQAKTQNDILELLNTMDKEGN